MQLARLSKWSLLVNWEAGELAVGPRRLTLHGSVLNHGKEGRRWKWGWSGHHSPSNLLLNRGHGRNGVETRRQLVLLHGPHKGNHGGQLDWVVHAGALCDSSRLLLLQGARGYRHVKHRREKLSGLSKGRPYRRCWWWVGRHASQWARVMNP